MLILKWTAEHECKKQVSAEGITATIHLKKDSSFQFPESGEREIKRQFSDALKCGYCVIEKVGDDSFSETDVNEYDISDIEEN